MSDISVSKGVFVYKNDFTRAKKSSRKKRKELTKNPLFSGLLWHQSYNSLWQKLEEKILVLNLEMFASILRNLVTFVHNCYNNIVTEVPAAALLIGINMPDHEAQFSTLAEEIKENVTPHVATLTSQDCQSLKCAVESMINQFINDIVKTSDDEDCDTDNETPNTNIKKSNMSFQLLQAWYEDLYEYNSTSTTSRSLKKTKYKDNKRMLVVLIPDFEGFKDVVIQDFILIISSYINVLPFVLIFGVATSITSLHKALPYHVSSKINTRVFNSQPSTIYLNNVLENVFITSDCPFQLGGKVFNLFSEIFLFYDFSVTGFIRNYKYAMMEHYSKGNAMALCTKKKIRTVLEHFTHEDYEMVRQILSFRKLVESETYENQILLLTSDSFLNDVIKTSVKNVKHYISRLHLFIKCLHILVNDLPKAPLGKQVREIYAIVTSQNITQTPEFQECFQLLSFQSKDELTSKLSNIVELIINNEDNSIKSNKHEITDFLTEIKAFSKKLNNIFAKEFEDLNAPEDECIANHGKIDRKQWKEKLLERTKPMNVYEQLRAEILQFLSNTFEKFLLEPSTFTFHEIFFFNDIVIQNHIIGTHRTAIHTALNDPHYYLQCTCCEIECDDKILSCMPDICIAYKLHLECGKMINLYDWLQAFLSIVDPIEADDESRRIVDPKLQARFTQAITELEYLGFIKSSKRKRDHVSRLTWGG